MNVCPTSIIDDILTKSEPASESCTLTHRQREPRATRSATEVRHNVEREGGREGEECEKQGKCCGRVLGRGGVGPEVRRGR